MNASKRRVFVDRFNSSEDIYAKVQQAFAWLGDGVVKSNDHVFIKPNLTYPFFKPGVTTSPEFMEALVKVLANVTSHITFVESDGGSYAWPALQAMAGHNLPDLSKRYGVRLMNLTERPRREVICKVAGRDVRVELSAEMLDESDLFITMPVPKVHVMTYLSLGYKNQWGCIPDVKRLTNHPDFDFKVLAVNQALRAGVALYDGTYFLNRTGPMDGDPVKKNLVIASTDIGAGDAVCCEIMRLMASKASHLKLAQRVGMMPKNLSEITIYQDLAPFQSEKFYLRRTAINWITLSAFHSHLLTKLVYNSRSAKPIHELLYLVRGKPRDVAPKW
ncbi:MAG: DUF362 domain-containing protein [Chloroflexi bacterium]|nr:DUF362 domain-containing protein [Chloroflexota bacterium]